MANTPRAIPGFQSTFVPLAQQHELEEQEKSPEEDSSTFDRVVELLNQAQLAERDEKLQYLRQVQELIVNKEPALLDNFLDEMAVHIQDRNPDARRFVLGFTEEACKTDTELLSKEVIHHVLLQGIHDSTVNVKKKMIMVMTQLYPVALKHVCSQRTMSDDLSKMWRYVDDLKNLIIEEINGENDGVRTHVIKFMEMLVLVLSKKTVDSEQPKGKDAVDISLDLVPVDHGVLKMPDLCEDCGMCLESLLGLTTLADISSTNLMTVIQSLSAISRQRPTFMATVVQSFEALHANLPPFTKSQVSSVRKNMKSQLLAILRHPSCVDFKVQVTTLLADLGATPAEIAKNMPQILPESSKRSRSDGDGMPPAKKLKLQDGSEENPEYAAFLSRLTSTSEAINDFHQDITERLTPVKCAELVFVSMRELPDSMPSTFRETFTPIAAAGTQQQIAHLARLMAIQITAAGLGPAAAKIGVDSSKPGLRPGRRESRGRDPRRKSAVEDRDAPNEDHEPGPLRSIPGLSPQLLAGVGLSNIGMAELLLLTPELIQLGVDPEMAAKILPRIDRLPPVSEAVSAMTAGTTDVERLAKSIDLDIPTLDDERETRKRRTRHIKQFKLSEVTQSIHPDQAKGQMLKAYRRLLSLEQSTVQGEAATDRIKILVGLAVQFPDPCRMFLVDYVLEDVRSRSEIAFEWLFEEYCLSEGCYDKTQTVSERELQRRRYDESLTFFLTTLRHRLDAQDRFFTKVLLEAPCVTQGALEIVRSYCEDDDHVELGLSTLCELVLKRPAAKGAFLLTLLDLTSHAREMIRERAIHVVKKLHRTEKLADEIEKYACRTLSQLHCEHPSISEINTEVEVAGGEWTEEAMKICLHLFLSLLPLQHRLIHDLAIVYVDAPSNIKKAIHKHIEKPVREIGMNSPELLKLVENCPHGAESLVTRMLHTLTIDTRPTAELVKRVRELYHRRVSDVRFLIPVLVGLDKTEVITALPQLIKQQQPVVREVLNRLLSCQQGGSSSGNSPLSPSELLISLHGIEDKDDMKAVIKAVNFCFEKKIVFTQEVLAVVLQQLAEQSPLPTLLMRTVIQSLSVYPRLVGFVMGILTRLIAKQAWKQPKVWQGFVKCTSMTKPQSYTVLLQLPPRQLESAFELAEDLRESLGDYVKGLAAHQKSQIPRPILNVIEGIKKSASRKTRKSTAGEDAAGHADKAKEKKKERRESGAGESKPFGELAAVAARVRQASINSESIASAKDRP